jgi:redox-sensitive bicupin YhaK (pirin superfamily)
VQLAPDTEFTQPVPSGHTALAYVFEGEGVFVGDPHPSGTISTSSGQAIEAVHLVKFEDGDQLRVKTEKDSVRFMLMAGKPFKEPIAPYGPFVMNTMEEIQQTLVELRNGTFIK